jgi:hypothetical protein
MSLINFDNLNISIINENNELVTIKKLLTEVLIIMVVIYILIILEQMAKTIFSLYLIIEMILWMEYKT